MEVSMTQFVSCDRCKLSSLRVRLSILLVVFALLLMPATSHAQGWIQDSPVDSPSARAFFTMAYDPLQSQVVLFGGWNATGVLDHTWVWQDANWTREEPAHSPSKRWLASMAYDAAAGNVVLFGGVPSSPDHGAHLSDTWVWNGTDWKQEHPDKSPSARGYAGMAYDAAAGNVVLFGGKRSSSVASVLSDTWLWNGVDWKQEHPAKRPSARAFPAMTYDEAAGNVVLFGGLDSKGDALGDTWVWNGTGWTQEHPATTPDVCYSATMAYDETEGQVVLFGGLESNGEVCGNIWLWNGTNWALIDQIDPPAPRFGAATAFDEAEGQVVLFGGLDSFSGSPGSIFGDTWVMR
jgi:Galactose oxidase, central domain